MKSFTWKPSFQNFFHSIVSGVKFCHSRHSNASLLPQNAHIALHSASKQGGYWVGQKQLRCTQWNIDLLTKKDPEEVKIKSCTGWPDLPETPHSPGQIDHAADDTVLYWTWYLLPKLPWVQQGLVLALSSSQTLISTAIGRIAPTSPGGTQAWSRFHGDETYPGLRFHFVYISQQYYKEIVPGRMSATWGRQVEERESPGYRRELWEFLPNQGELGSHLAKKRSELPLT